MKRKNHMVDAQTEILLVKEAQTREESESKVLRDVVKSSLGGADNIDPMYSVLWGWVGSLNEGSR